MKWSDEWGEGAPRGCRHKAVVQCRGQRVEREQARRYLRFPNINEQSLYIVEISIVTLIRTDTTLDLSQKAEKSMITWSLFQNKEVSFKPTMLTTYIDAVTSCKPNFQAKIFIVGCGMLWADSFLFCFAYSNGIGLRTAVLFIWLPQRARSAQSLRTK